MFVNNGIATWVHAEVMDNEVRFTLTQLSRACGAEDSEIMALVQEGVLVASDHSNLYFDNSALTRARTALRLLHDLELDAHATALVLDLLDEIDQLREQLAHAQARLGTERA